MLKPNSTRLLLLAGIGAAGALLVLFTVLTWSNPLLDHHAFRQTQTAVNAHSIAFEGAFPAYLTPVLGAPWSIPFEAPIYQAVVASIVRLTGADLESIGKLVSLAFFAGAIVLACRISEWMLPSDPYVSRLLLLLGLLSPLYLFWSRTFMIETCALFLSTAWLLCVIRSLDTRPLVWATAAIPLSILAALTKITTLVPFVAAYAVCAAWRFMQTRTVQVLPVLLSMTGLFVAFGAMVVWTQHADAVKAASPFGDDLTSVTLTRWNFGTWSQLLSIKPAYLLFHRMLPDVLGYGWPVLIACIWLIRGDRLRLTIVLFCTLFFFVPIVIFTNLHLVHDYYQVANGIFLVVSAAVLISGLIAMGRPRWAAFLCLYIVIGSQARFFLHQWTLTKDLGRHPSYIAGTLVDHSTDPQSSMIVFGIDWSPEIHYYAQRKGVALPRWSSVDKAKRLLDGPDLWMGGLRLASVVDCRHVLRYVPPSDATDMKLEKISLHYSSEVDEMITTFLRGWIEGGARLVSDEHGTNCLIYVK
jgi:hypothetical protein